MLQFHETFCLALGIALSMYYYHWTGKACGGIITPGFVALHVHDPLALGISLASGLAVCAVLAVLVRMTGIYGRQRLAAAMLAALALKLPLPLIMTCADPWLGWVLPGLIGADMQRQGVAVTLWAVLATGIASAMVFQLGLAGADTLVPFCLAIWGNNGH